MNSVEIYTVCFFGHRRILNQLPIDRKLEEVIANLLQKHNYVEFLVGRDGDFDQMVSSAIRRCQREYGHANSLHIWGMPYLTSFFRDNEEACYAYYDEIEICEKSSGAHFMSAFQVRNKSMVDRSDLVICYIETNEGGAFQTLQYTIQQGKEYLNLYSTKEEMELEKP